MARYIDFILAHRLGVSAAILLVSVAAALMCTQATIASSLGGLFFGESPKFQRYLDRSDEFGSDDFLLVAFDDAELLTPAGLDKLEGIVNQIRELPDVGRVISLLDGRRIRHGEGGLEVDAYADLIRANPKSAETVAKALREDPLIGGLLISKEGTTAAVITALTPDADRPAEQMPLLCQQIIDRFLQAGFKNEQLYRAGTIPTVSEVTAEAYFNLQSLFPLICSLLLLTVWIMFRRLWPVVVNAVVAIIGVLWTMGLAVFLDRNVGILTTIVPCVLIIISFSDVVHLCSAYLVELTAGRSREDAIRSSAIDVGTACILTSATTGVGFLSLGLVPTPAFRLLGPVLGFGVGTALLLAMTITPILLSVLPAPPPKKSADESRVQRGMTKLLDSCVRWSIRHPKPLAFVFLAAFAILLVGAERFTIETNFNERLHADHALRVEQRWLEERFAPAHMLSIYAETEHDGGLLDPETFQRLAAFHDAMVAHPEVEHVQSLVSLIRELHQHLAGKEIPSKLGVPLDRGALAQYLLLFEMSGGNELSELINFPRRGMRYAARLETGDLRSTTRIGDELRSQGDALLEGHASLEPSGLSYLIGDWLDEIVRGQVSGLALALGIIALLMMIGLGSVRVGFWSMLPNILPSLAVVGVLGFSQESVDSDILTICIIALGIGVDDTVHFLMRLRIESERCANSEEAIRQALRFAGRGIVITTVVLVIGFVPFLISDYYPLAMFGSFLPFALVVALIADLLLVPAMVQLGPMRFPAPSKSAVGALESKDI